MAAKYWFAADYNNTPPQLQEGNTIVCREFCAVVNAAGGSTNGISNITSLASTGPDVIALCTLPGQGYGITVDDYFIDFGGTDTASPAALVLELGLLLTSTTTGAATSSLDTGSTSMAAAGYFATLITPSTVFSTAKGYWLSPQAGLWTSASTPLVLPVTFNPGALPLMITNMPGGNTAGNVATYPNSGLYDLCLTVTTSATTLATSTPALIKGWVKYHTNSVVIQS